MRWGASIPALGWFMLGGFAAHAQPVCLEQRIQAPTPTIFHCFGQDVAIWGDTAIAGEPSVQPSAPGAAYIFDFTVEDGWSSSAKLTAFDGAAGERFGEFVALQENALAVGTIQHVHPGALGGGVVYTWRREGEEWHFMQKVVPEQCCAGFGRLVDFDRSAPFSQDGGRMIVTQSVRQVHVLLFDGDAWVQEQTISEPEEVGFGVSVAIDGDVLVVGAPFAEFGCWDPDNGTGDGKVFVYRFDGTEWIEEQALGVPGSHCFRSFGRAVSVSGNTIVASAGAPGAAYVFEYDESAGQWIETAILATPLTTTLFGERPRSVEIQGDTILIGDTIHGANAPRAFVFQRGVDGLWIERAVLWQDPGVTGTYGASVRLQGGRAIIGAHGEDQKRGAAYIYDVKPKTGDLNCSGAVGVDDLLLLISSWGQCPATPYPGSSVLPPCNADLNGDGIVNVFDLLKLLTNWG